MSTKTPCPQMGTAIVPRWFIDVLHEVIYADGTDGHLAMQALSTAISSHSPTDTAIMTEWANGFSQTQIAANLGLSRHCVCRRIRTLIRRFGKGFQNGLHGNKTAAATLALFDFKQGTSTPAVRHAVDRLAALSPVELCVLSSVVRLLPEHETLTDLGIKHSWYHTIKARLNASFWLCPFQRKKIAAPACIEKPNLLSFAPLTEKCTFLFIFLFSYRRDARFSVSLSLFYAVRLISKTTISRCATFQETWNRAFRTVAPPPVRTSRRVAQDWRPPGTGAANQLSDAQTSPLAPLPHQSPAAASF